MSLLSYQIQELIQQGQEYEYYYEDMSEIRMRLRYWIDELFDIIQDIDDDLGDSGDDD
tara:strand:+ start:442 stop:615 length:174 start_codon:yes stop_codon:yes gene_type:complete